MPPSKHAVLSASGAHRWLHCNPSARLELEFADRETEAAAEGTAAHALAEHKLKKALKLRSRKPVSPYDCDEMDAYTDGYVEFVLEQLEEARALCADPLVLIEQRLDFSCYGTTNPITILLQRNGFSREVSTYIRNNKDTFIIEGLDGKWHLSTALLKCSNTNARTEALSVRYNMPELFVAGQLGGNQHG